MDRFPVAAPLFCFLCRFSTFPEGFTGVKTAIPIEFNITNRNNMNSRAKQRKTGAGTVIENMTFRYFVELFS